MRIAYFDCFWGISGDMVLASLVDAGLDSQDLISAFGKAKLDFFSLQENKIDRNGICATRILIRTKKKTHYSYLEFCRVLEQSKLSNRIKKRSLVTFKNLAQAEKKVHEVKTKDFHFEQLGEIDTLADIVGTFIALDLLGIEKVYFSKIRLAQGGTFPHDGQNLPLPGPAVLELLRGIPVELIEALYEYVTPTGAALVRNLRTAAKIPPFRILSVGYGAGTKKFGLQPNLLHVIIGETVKVSQSHS